MMLSKTLVLAVGATGYVLGARAGRERYDQIVAAARKVRSNPTVQDAASTVRDAAADAAPVVRDKATATLGDLAVKAKEKATSRDQDSSGDQEVTSEEALPGTAKNPFLGADR